MKPNLLFSTLLLALSLTLLGGCASRPTIEKLVPEDTPLYFQVNDPDAFLQDLDSYITPLGLKSQIGGMRVREFLELQLSTRESIIPFDAIDFASPVGIAAQTGTVQGEMDFILFFPIVEERNPEDMAVALKNGADLSAVPYKNYLVIFSTPEDVEAFPPKNPLDLSLFREYPDNSLKAYMNFQSLVDAIGIDFQELSALMEDQLEDTNPMTGKILKGYADFLREISGLYGNMQVDDERMGFRGDLVFQGDMARHLKSITPMSGIKEYAEYLGEESLYQCLYNIHPDDLAVLSEKMVGLYLNNTEVESEDRERYLTLTNDMVKTMGPAGAFSFDMDIAPEFLEDGFEGLDCEVTGIMTLSDPEEFLRIMSTLYEEPVLNVVMNQILSESGMQMKILFEEHPEDPDLPYYEIGYSVKAIKSKSLDPQRKESIKMMRTLFEKLKIYTAVRDDLYYLYLGKNGAAGLRDLVYSRKDEPATNGLSWLESMPDTANCIWKLSLRDMAAQLLSASGNPEPIPAGDEADFFKGYIQAGDEISGGIILPTSELLWIVRLASLGANQSQVN